MLNNKFQILLLPHNRKINVNAGAKAGKTLMESLIKHGIFLRSDCGGKGKCGKCRVRKILNNGEHEIINACTYMVTGNIKIEIPESSIPTSHIITKPPVSFPASFKKINENDSEKDCYGIATDLGTTTIAMYLCNMTQCRILSSMVIKNPQSLYGDDVISRIGAICQKDKRLDDMQKLVIRALEWGVKKLLESSDFGSGFEDVKISQMVTVGNPAMIHILAGVDPKSIGISPFQPAFYAPRIIPSRDLGFAIKDFSIQTLPQVSGFIGGDILGAAIATDLENQPEGTLLIDLGTNGELMLKGKDRLFATSCATGPAFEGASLSCGMQAIPGAVNRVKIKDHKDAPKYSFINQSESLAEPLAESPEIKPSGICGTGVISAVSQLYQNNIIGSDGAFKKNTHLPFLKKDFSGKRQFVLVPEKFSAYGSEIFISQKDIRSVQLGKAALITGIEFLLKKAGIDNPEKIIIAGAFGSFIDKEDMMTLGMIPEINPSKVKIAGNSAGAGAIMVLCDSAFLEKAIKMAKQVIVVDLACNQDFQKVFIQKLNFPAILTT